MKMYKKIVVIAGVLVLALTLIQPASAKPKTLYTNGVWTTILKDVPSTVKVGQVYKVKLKYTNRYRERRNHYKRQAVKLLPFIEWGAYSYASKNDKAPVAHYWKSSKSRTVKARRLKPGQSRTVTYKVSFNECLPPWGQDWGGQPGDYFYWGLPCASGHYYFLSTGVTKGSRWLPGFTRPYERHVLIVPAGQSAATPAPAPAPVDPTPTGPTGSSGPTGPTD